MYNINYLETSALVTYHLKSLWFYTFCLFVTLIFQTSLGRQKLLMTSCLSFQFKPQFFGLEQIDKYFNDQFEY